MSPHCRLSPNQYPFQVPDGDVPQPDVALRTGEGQQPAEGLPGRDQQPPVAPAPVGQRQQGDQRGHDRLLVADLVGRQVAAAPGQLQRLVAQPLEEAVDPGPQDARRRPRQPSDGRVQREHRLRVADRQVPADPVAGAGFQQGGGQLQVVGTATVAVLEDEEVDQPGGVVQPGARGDVGRPAPDPAVGVHQAIAGEGGELLQGGVHVGGPGGVDQAAGAGLGQQHRHRGPFGAVRPVRPPLVGHGQPGAGVAGHEPTGPGPLARAVMVEQDGDAPPHQLGQRPVEQQPDADGVAVVADVELDHRLGPARDRRAVRGALHGQTPVGPPGLGPG